MIIQWGWRNKITNFIANRLSQDFFNSKNYFPKRPCFPNKPGDTFGNGPGDKWSPLQKAVNGDSAGLLGALKSLECSLDATIASGIPID